jgi:hypothetical protein
MTLKTLATVKIETLMILPAALLVLGAALTDSDDTLAKARALHQAQDYDGAIALLAPLVEEEPENARAWLAYGRALQKKGALDAARKAFDKAVVFDDTKLAALYGIASIHALKGETDACFAALEELRGTKAYNLTDIGLDDDFVSLSDDPRFQKLYPSPEDYADPFVEPATILKEWRGEAARDWFGWIARNIGDVDGDGVDDVTTSAPNKDIGGAAAGRVYVFSGKTGKRLWDQSGAPGDRLGIGIEAAGDTDRDGIPDVVAGAPGAGKAYVYSGDDGHVLLTLEQRQENELFGQKVADVGDVNGDQYDDVLVGAPGNDEKGEGAGRASVYSGKDGNELLTWYGEEAGDRFGSAAGGYSRGERVMIAVGAPDAGDGDRGRVYVYGERAGKLAFTIDPGEKDAELGGMFVSIVGDVDADGQPDVYASDWSSNAAARGAGRIYVYSGATGKRLLVLDGEAEGDGFGIGPADAGDVDGDGHADLVIGAWQHGGAAPSGGKVYLFSGRDGTVIRTWTGKVPGETFGFDATGIGDVDADGRLDFLLTSAWSAVNGSRSGRMYILSGR